MSATDSPGSKDPVSKKPRLEEDQCAHREVRNLHATLLSALEKEGDRIDELGLKGILQKAINSAQEVPDETDTNSKGLERKNRQIPEDFPREYLATALLCVKLHFHCTNKDGDVASDHVYNPEYSHQIFTTDDFLLGYKDLQLGFYYSPSMRMYAEERFSKKLEHELTDEDPLVQFGASQAKPRLSENYTNKKEEFLEWIKSEEKPLSYGKVIQEYMLEKTLFHIAHSSLESEEEKLLFDRLQALTIWFIENGSTTSLDETAFQLYTTYDTEQNSIVAFATVFLFVNPFLKASSSIMRICQVVVLPQYRRKGHAQRLLKAIYRIAADNNDIHEVTVEDPCPEFARLRDLVEVHVAEDLGAFKNKNFDKGLVDKNTLTRIKKKTKLTDKQIQRAYEILRWKDLNSELVDNVKRFRLDVKRRLRIERAEDLDHLADKEAIKQKLAEFYDEVISEYNAVLKRPGT